MYNIDYIYWITARLYLLRSCKKLTPAGGSICKKVDGHEFNGSTSKYRGNNIVKIYISVEQKYGKTKISQDKNLVR